jgi:hypothetical protein
MIMRGEMPRFIQEPPGPSDEDTKRASGSSAEGEVPKEVDIDVSDFESPEAIEEIPTLSEEDMVEVKETPPLLPKREGPPPLPESKEAKERKAERKMLHDVLTWHGLNGEAAVEIIAAYGEKEVSEEELQNEFGFITEEYGLPVEDIPDAERRRLLVMYNGMKHARRGESKDNIGDVLETAMHRRMVMNALNRVEALNTALVSSKGVEELAGGLRETMRSLSAVAGQVKSAKDEVEQMMMGVFSKFNEVLTLKKAAVNERAQEAFTEVFGEFQEFIEDDVVMFRIDQLKKAGQSASVEHLMQETYGRTPEEMEEVKANNRAEVAAAIKEMADEPYVTLDMLKKLHEINNNGIVPKDFSKFREELGVTFGKARRIGLQGEDVANEMAALVERANDLIDRDILKGVSKLRYEIESASLHNDMLDIHPFIDRNGSTSLLLLELMMARKGYEPSPEREKDYYKNLTRILGYNPAAVAVVGYEQLKMTYKPGFFKGETMTPERKAHYERAAKNIAAHFKQLKKKYMEQRSQMPPEEGKKAA